ncbi:MAG: hypothetical protein ACPHBR_04555 [Flavobacteriales bacterium]
MPNKHLTQHRLSLLAEHVGEAVGFEVTCTRDCEVLSDELRAHDGRYPVSISTLRRFFGLIPRKGGFSQTTLNTLARYIGYSSYRAWEAAQASHPPTDQPNRPSNVETGLFDSRVSTTSSEAARPKLWSEEDAYAQVRAFIAMFPTEESFRLSATQFQTLKEAVFHIYQRGTFDMSLWMEVTRHAHLLRFVVEQFPPLDFMSTFGKDMMETYLDLATTPNQIAYAKGVLAAGAAARGKPWTDVLSHLPPLAGLNPSLHPLVHGRNLGIRLLGLSEMATDDDQLKEVRMLVLEGLARDVEIWPRWAHQNCYFAFNLADYAVLSGDREIVAAISKTISEFQNRQDWYNRNSDVDTILALRQVWNALLLGDKEAAAQTLVHLEWGNFLSMEVRTLGMWYHTAMGNLGLAPKEVCAANTRHCGNLTGYTRYQQALTDLHFLS